MRARHHILAFIRARLTPAEYLGLHLTLGVLAIIIGIWLFVVIADSVHTRGRAAEADLAAARWLHLHASPTLTIANRWVTHLGSPWLVLPAGAGIAIVFARWRHWYAAAAVFLSVGGGMALNTVLKLLFSRPRPTLHPSLVDVVGYSFPSGHVAGATLLYGTLAYLALHRVRSARWRAAAVAAACLAIVAVSFTRLYLGVHYLSDVLAAQAVACSWVALCVTTMETFRRRAQAMSPPPT